MKLPNKLIKRIMQVLMSALNLSASILVWLGVISISSPVVPLLFGASSVAFGLYLLSDIIQVKMQNSVDKISEIIAKYKTDDNKMSIQLNNITEVLQDIQSVRSEIHSIKQMSEQHIYVNRNEPILEIQTPTVITHRTPRYKCIFNKADNTLEIEEDI